jgi:membrane protein YqaA with SNARE-associated domain
MTTKTETAQLNLKGLALRFMGTIVVLMIAIGVVGFVIRDEVISLSRAFVDATGAWGVLIGFFIPDAFTVPVPHEAFLAFGLMGGLDFWVIGAYASVGSVCGGCVGYGMTRWLGHTAWFQALLERRGAAHSRVLIEKYGVLALALGALTPLPYSIMAWTCGALGMRFLPFLLTSLLRVPRVFFYLWLVELGVVEIIS